MLKFLTADCADENGFVELTGNTQGIGPSEYVPDRSVEPANISI
jgi:hypothetical protein